MLTIAQLLALDGPNIFSPHTCVIVQLHADQDVRHAYLLHLKEAAQRVGLVLAGIDASTVPASVGYQVTVQFRTPTPDLGAAVARFVTADLRAEQKPDAGWDADQQLYELQQLRREAALPITTLQLLAEAQARGIPSFRRADGYVQIGYGTRGMALPIERPVPQDLVASDTIGIRCMLPHIEDVPTLDWQQLGGIPVLALNGIPSLHADIVTTLYALSGVPTPSLTRAARWDTSSCAVLGASFAEVRTALARSSTTTVVASLSPESMYAHGLPFEQCDACVILGLPDIALPDTQRIRLAGLPMLVTQSGGSAALNADIPELTLLVEYAPCPLIWFSQHETNLPQHAGITIRHGQVWRVDAHEAHRLGDLLPGLEITAQLAAWAILSAETLKH